MRRIVRLYLDCVLVGLALGVVILAVLAVLSPQVQQAVLDAERGWRHAGMIVVFAAGVASSVSFAVGMVRLELSQDRAIAWRKRHGWGRSPRDRRKD